jgi:hypothetical protein
MAVFDLPNRDSIAGHDQAMMLPPRSPQRRDQEETVNPGEGN